MSDLPGQHDLEGMLQPHKSLATRGGGVLMSDAPLQGSRFGAGGFGAMVWDSGFRAQGSGVGVWGLGSRFRVQGLGFRV